MAILLNIKIVAIITGFTSSRVTCKTWASVLLF